MQGTPVGPVSEPGDAGCRALSFVCRLLSASTGDLTGLETLLAGLASAFNASAAGIATLENRGVITIRARAGTATNDLCNWPWNDDLELVSRVRAANTAVCIVRPGNGSLLLTVATFSGGAGWLLWLEDSQRTAWETPLPAAFALAGQAIARQLTSSDSRSRWAEQMDRIIRQEHLEAAARVARRLAHDFGNVLTGILGFSELSLTRDVSPDTTLHRFLMEVYRGAQDGAAFTHQLRLFSRRHPISPVPSALATVLYDEETRFRSQGGETSLLISLPADLPLLAMDTEHLRQVMSVLLDNAREAAGPTGSVNVHARVVRLTTADCLDYFGNARVGEHVEIVVTDNGPGLTPEARQWLFRDPFFTTKPRRRGFGLATAYGILHAHGGGFRLLSGTSGGMRAETVVPVAARLARQEETADESAGEKVLVVDDDPRVLHFVTTTLERAGYRVQSAASAGEALSCYAAAAGPDPFRLVLSDVLMPEVNGVDLARRLLGNDPNVCVLFMSGHVGPDFPRQSLDGKQFELLPKPFRVDGLLRAVRGALDRTSARKAAWTSGSSDGPMYSSSL